MRYGGTFLNILIRTLLGLAMASSLGCLIDDPPPCTIQDDVSPDARCGNNVADEVLFKVEYVTADGTRPDGRYYFVESAGVTVSTAESECRNELQRVFNTDQAYVDLELNEVRYYRGNVCGPGFRLKFNRGEVKVKRTRKTGAHTYDYTLELTCTNW